MAESLKRVLCTVMYHGAHYQGWQVQVNAPTIQATIQKALSNMHHNDIKIHGSGRTDTGVHAFGQTFHFDTPFKLSEAQWMKAINSSLPKDIRILDVVFVDRDFHARYSATGKHYDYLILLEEANPFTYQTHLSITDPLDLNEMRKAANMFIGAHDFSSFCANTKEDTPNQVRTLHNIEIIDEEGQIRLVFEGDGFMRYMIRMLVAALIDVGTQRLSIQALKEILEAKDKKAFGGIVDGCGLYLMEVFY